MKIKSSFSLNFIKNMKSNMFGYLILIFILSSCDFNILGGSKSKLSEGYNPGLRIESLPPTISSFADLELDENDTRTIPFKISDPDTFLFCSGVNLATRSSNSVALAPVDIEFTGTYPDCNLKINTRSVTQSSVVRLTIEVTDFWSTVGASFNVTIRRVERPGPFRITAHEGLRKSFIVNWSNADYMDGSSARYYLYFKKIADQSLQPTTFLGILPSYLPSPPASQTSFVEVRNVKSPAFINDLAYELEDSTVYEVYLTARNSFNIKNPTVPPTESDHVFIRTLDQYQFKVREFVSSSRQDYLAPNTDHGGDCATNYFAQGPVFESCNQSSNFFVQTALGSPMERTTVPTGSGRFRVELNAQGLMYGDTP